jgi:hypothetical protein
MNIFDSLAGELLKAIGYFPVALVKWLSGGCKKPYKSYLNYESAGNDLIVGALVLALVCGIFLCFTIKIAIPYIVSKVPNQYTGGESIRK